MSPAATGFTLPNLHMPHEARANPSDLHVCHYNGKIIRPLQQGHSGVIHALDDGPLGEAAPASAEDHHQAVVPEDEAVTRVHHGTVGSGQMGRWHGEPKVHGAQHLTGCCIDARVCSQALVSSTPGPLRAVEATGFGKGSGHSRRQASRGSPRATLLLIMRRGPMAGARLDCTGSPAQHSDFDITDGSVRPATRALAPAKVKVADRSPSPGGPAARPLGRSPGCSPGGRGCHGRRSGAGENQAASPPDAVRCRSQDQHRVSLYLGW